MKTARLTNKHAKDLLPGVLRRIGALHKDRPDLIVAFWPDLIGKRLSGMTQAMRFEEGILFVKVQNSTLYSVLSQHERGKLLKKLRQQFPRVGIKNIHFRLGS